MTDVRDKDINVIPFDGGLTVLKGGFYICTKTNSGKFNSILASMFQQDAGLQSSTLREIADIIDTIEEQQDNKKTDGMNGTYSAGRQRGGETLNVD